MLRDFIEAVLPWARRIRRTERRDRSMFLWRGSARGTNPDDKSVSFLPFVAKDKKEAIRLMKKAYNDAPGRNANDEVTVLVRRVLRKNKK